MRQLLHVVVVAMLTLCASASVAQETERRVALVIGVAAYEQEIARLTNPIGDAQRVHAALRATGFETPEPLLNPNFQQLQRALRDFGRIADHADVAVLYFAGHGIEQHNDNWLIPTDATLLHPDDVLAEGVSMQNVVRLMGRARMRIVFLDACRNNPFLVRWPGTRAGPDGLVRVADENLPQGTFVAFAAPAGQRAPDDGAFARSLAERMDDEGVSLEQLISRVSDDIGREVTISKQMQPADFFFVPGISEEDRFWQAFQADIDAGRCDSAGADLQRYAARRPREQQLFNIVRATVLPTCRPRQQTATADIVSRPDYLTSLRATDRTPLTRADYEAVAARLGAEWEAVAAVAEVESGPLGGFMTDGRPNVLFERHLFSRRTNSIYDTTHPQVSNRTPGGYPRTQAERWAQMEQAFALDAEAALQSTSYGRFLVLGQNYSNLGMANAHEYVSKLARSERDQLEAFEGFIRANGLADELRDRRWADFARRYNGPGYAQNQYDTRMAQAYARLKANPGSIGGSSDETP